MNKTNQCGRSKNKPPMTGNSLYQLSMVMTGGWFIIAIPLYPQFKAPNPSTSINIHLFWIFPLPIILGSSLDDCLLREGRVTLLPEELSGPQERCGLLHFPSHHTAPPGDIRKMGTSTMSMGITICNKKQIWIEQIQMVTVEYLETTSQTI